MCVCVCVCVCVCALCLCGCPHLLTSVAMAECSTCYGCVGDSMPLMVVAPTLSNSLFGNSYMYIYICIGFPSDANTSDYILQKAQNSLP